MRKKIKQIQTVNLIVYSRKILIDGYSAMFDLQGIKGYTTQLQKIGMNINQIARRINETGCIFYDDITRIMLTKNYLKADFKCALTIMLGNTRN